MNNSYRVLLVDDEKASHELVGDFLAASKQDQFELDWVDNYDAGLAALLRDEHDVCLLDYNLTADESFSGLYLMQTARKRGSRMAIVMLTGQGSRDIDMNALEAGAADFLDKSKLKPDLLRRAIRYTVKHRQDRNKLEDLYSQVRELEQLKTDMIRIAAHDLRTPLMTMLNYANFLRDDKEHPLEDYQQGYVGDIIASVRRMQQIISDILSLERIKETAAERYDGTVDLAEQVHVAADACLPATPVHTVHIDAPERGIMVRGDSAQLREAATNLITNAIKYTPPEESITMQLVVEGDHAVFTVTDTGYGIPEAMQERLFSPFYRAKTKETRKIEGTGLGLHLVKNIVQRHHGEIILHSVYGEGSTFGFRVPLLR
ncbi:MAG: ATP-binding protein, partial [Chloroflexota bacterium]